MNAPADRARAAAAGFTLAEMLVALTLLGLVLTMIFGGLRFGTRSWDAVIDNSRDRDRIMATQAFLRGRLNEFSRPRLQARTGNATAGGLHGTAEELIFEAPWLSQLAVGGIYRFTLGRAGPDAPDQLVLAWQPAREGWEDQDQGEVAGQRVLLEGVQAISIAYFGPVEVDGEPMWLPEWPPSAPAPELVEIDVRFRDPSRQWPPFVVRPAR